MLNLYYSPGACSLATHIALRETGEMFDAHSLDFAKQEQRSPEYLKVNPHGRVPALATDEGVVTEGPAILSYIAERYPETKLNPGDAYHRAHVRQLVAFFSGTVHPTFAHIFRPERYVGEGGPVDAAKATAMATLPGYFAEIDALFAKNDWAAGADYTIADCYPFVFYRWARRVGFDMRAYEAWTKYIWRMLDRPAVAKAVEAEGLARADWIEVD